MNCTIGRPERRTTGWQTPATQAPPRQSCAHEPQLPGSVCSSAHVSTQSDAAPQSGASPPELDPLLEPPLEPLSDPPSSPPLELLDVDPPPDDDPELEPDPLELPPDDPEPSDAASLDDDESVAPLSMSGLPLDPPPPSRSTAVRLPQPRANATPIKTIRSLQVPTVTALQGPDTDHLMVS